MRALVLAVLPLALVGCRSAAPLLVSAAGPVVVDGDAGEWANGLRPVPGEAGLSLGLRNTAEALTVVLVAGDAWQARRVASGGLTLWLDPTGGAERTVGLRFPIGVDDPAGPSADESPAASETALRDAFVAATTRLETLRPGGGRGRSGSGAAAVGSVAGVETAAAWTGQGLVVEVQLPVRGPAAAAFAGEVSGTTVGLGIELAERRRGPAAPPAPSMTGRRPDGRMDGYGADRQGDRDTAAPQDPSRLRTPGTATTWIGVALAP